MIKHNNKNKMEHSVELEQFATDIYDEVSVGKGRIEFILVTDNTDLEDFNVTIIMYKLGLAKGGYVDFRTAYRIESQKIMWCDSRDTYTLVGDNDIPSFRFDEIEKKKAIEKIIQNIMKIDELFENVFLDNRVGCFINRKDDSEMRKYRMRNTKGLVFKHRKQPIPEVCCVCGDETNTTTMCKHKLCIRCWNKLDKLVCPCCRRSVEYARRDESDEEED